MSEPVKDKEKKEKDPKKINPKKLQPGGPIPDPNPNPPPVEGPTVPEGSAQVPLPPKEVKVGEPSVPQVTTSKREGFREKAIVIKMKDGRWNEVDFLHGDYDIPITPREILQACKTIEVHYKAAAMKARRESIQRRAKEEMRKLKESNLVASSTGKDI